MYVAERLQVPFCWTAPECIDTARYSAVVALDSAASPYTARIAEFVRSGGGLVMEPGAALLGDMSSLRAGNVGDVLSSSTSREAEYLASMSAAGWGS